MAKQPKVRCEYIMRIRGVDPTMPAFSRFESLLIKMASKLRADLSRIEREYRGTTALHLSRKSLVKAGKSA